MFTHKDSVVMKAASIISAFVLIVSAFPMVTSAATLVADSFGTGSSSNDIAGWEEQGNDSDSDVFAQASGSGEDFASPDGGRFAKIGEDEWMCVQVNAAGYNSLQLAYYWRGDSDAESSDRGYVEYKTSGNCDTGSSWTQLQNHDLSIDGSWSSQAAFSLPASLNNTTFNLRFRTDSSSSDEYFRVDAVNLTGSAIVVDTDTDGIADSSDNCPSVSNANQANNDGDSQGDACDTDDDNDTVADTTDNCDFDANLEQLDSDGDSIGNDCDETPYTDEQLCEQQDGKSWNGEECVEDETPEESCENGGGFWNGSDCEQIPSCDGNEEYNPDTNECDETVVLPTDEEICEANGGSWTGEICLPDACPEVDGFQPPLTDCDGPSDEELCEEQEGMSWNGEECVSDGPADEDSDEGDEGGNESENASQSDETEAPRPSRGHVDPMCNNNEDDDNDGLYDVNDPDCENGSDDSERPSGNVLGASTCAATITAYIGESKDNDTEQVKLLQEFLNKELGLDLEVNGEFDRPTLDAVKAFQAKYPDEILFPWGISDPTGYVYKLTLRKIAMISCPGTEIPMPELD